RGAPTARSPYRNQRQRLASGHAAHGRAHVDKLTPQRRESSSVVVQCIGDGDGVGSPLAHNIEQVLRASHTARCDDRYRHRVGYGAYESDVEALARALLID